MASAFSFKMAVYSDVSNYTGGWIINLLYFNGNGDETPKRLVYIVMYTV